MLVGLSVLAPLTNAQAQPTPMRANPLGRDFYWIEGGVGSNAGVRPAIENFLSVLFSRCDSARGRLSPAP